MANAFPCRVLLVTEGSGGHLVPALQVGQALAGAGASVSLWYAQRPRANWAQSLIEQLPPSGLRVEAVEVGAPASWPARLSASWRLWSRAQRFFDAAAPDVVAGFGGWISAPVLLAARRRGIRCLVHEQNVMLGRTNRLLAHYVDRVALSFHETEAQLRRTPAIVTGLPVRPGIGNLARAPAAAHWGFQAERPTVLVLGGSQGSRAVNELVVGMLQATDPQVLRQWQWLHISGASDVERVRAAYAAAGCTAHVAGFIAEMSAAYAAADVAVGRAGASTIAELARCGLPAIFIPYPHAHGHQRANAALAQAVGGAIILEEQATGPQQLFDALAALFQEPERCRQMGQGMRALDAQDAARRLSSAVLELATKGWISPTPCLSTVN